MAAIYGQLGGHEFLHFDDMDYIWGNPVVRGGLSKVGIVEAFGLGGHKFAYWQPLTFLSLMLDMELFGFAPAPIFLENALMHGLAACILFLALRRATGQLWPSLLAAALFAAHPMNVESVAWAVERKTVLSGLLCMATLYFYVRQAESPGWRRQVAVTVCFALGLMAKVSLAALPLALLALDFWPLRLLESPAAGAGSGARGMRRLTALLVEKWPLFLLSGAAMFLVILSRGDILDQGDGAFIPLELRLGNIPVSLARYVGNFLFPSDMVIFYPFPDANSFGAWGGCLLLCLVALAAAWRARRRFPYILAGVLFFLAMFLPVSGVIQTGLWPALADRFAYLPYVGFCLALAWGLYDACGALAALGAASRRQRAVVAALPLAVILYLGSIAWAQAGLWKNGVILFSHAVAIYPRNAVMQAQLGNAYVAVGRLTSALEHFKIAMELNPRYPTNYKLTIALFIQLGRWDSALGLARKAAGLFPHDREYRFFEQVIRFEQGEYVALDDLRQYLDSEKLESLVLYWMGEVAVKQKEWAEAVRAYDRLSELKPHDPKILANAGTAYLRIGDTKAAEDRFTRALSWYPNLAEALQGMAAILRGRGETARAQAMEDKALSIIESVSNAAYLLGENLLASGYVEDAKSQYRVALRIHPGHRGAKERLATLP